MSEVVLSNPPMEKQRTTGGQWGTIIFIIIIFIVIWVVIWLLIVNNFFSGGSNIVADTAPTPGCSPTGPPSGLTATQNNITTPSVNLSWNAVLNPATSGESILGYNVYSSETSNITKSNTSFVKSDTFTIFLTETDDGVMTTGTPIFVRVSTVDTCGEGDLSGEITFTPQ